MEKIAGIDTKKVTDPAERAMTDPGDVYDYNVRETSEIPDFQQAEAETSQEIAKEDAVDHCTTPDARYQNPALMDNSAEEVTEEVTPVTEETVEVDEEAPVVVEDEAVEEAPVVEETEAEAPEDEVAEDNVEEADDVAEDVEDETPEEDTFTFEDVDEAPLDEEEVVEKISQKKTKKRLLKSTLTVLLLQCWQTNNKIKNKVVFE
jgi:type IV secretory pathway VirB10-like protein